MIFMQYFLFSGNNKKTHSPFLPVSNAKSFPEKVRKERVFCVCLYARSKSERSNLQTGCTEQKQQQHQRKVKSVQRVMDFVFFWFTSLVYQLTYRAPAVGGGGWKDKERSECESRRDRLCVSRHPRTSMILARRSARTERRVEITPKRERERGSASVSEREPPLHRRNRLAVAT